MVPAFTHRMQQLFVATAVASASFALSSAAWAQSSYPNRPITVIAPYSAGGDADLAGRNFAAAAQRVLGQTVIVVNKTGASGVIVSFSTHDYVGHAFGPDSWESWDTWLRLDAQLARDRRARAG